ncbi:CoA-transferase subunit beta [Sciscionella marina]|uniref:CoA-transferase subunit beta n=1 Tax=Sciscionella marina TaxID=508770 RepID=UPI0003705C00|nr:hypothetical protein [Sciscionella marina]
MTAAKTTVSRAEICVGACAELFRGDGEILVSPMSTVALIGARLAKLTFEPDLLLTDGEAGLLAEVPVLGEQSEPAREGWLPFRRVFELLAHGRRHVVMGANQVDQYGNQNISAIGEHSRPDRQLLGVRGSPGNTVNHRTSYWVPKHSPRSFVEAVDVVAGVGYDRATGSAGRFHDVYRVVSNLGVFDFDGPQHRMRLVSAHPGVELEEITEATGFPLHIGEFHTTPEPGQEALELIRTRLDPKNLRDREVRA